MKTIKKNVYYCDYCNKKSLAAYHMQTHEKHCTMNPNRHCRLCEMSTTIAQDVAEFKSRFELIENKDARTFENLRENWDEYIVKWTAEPVTLEEIKEKYDNCPNCILAILRQTGMNKHYFHFKYDYQKENEIRFQEKKENQKDDYPY